MAQAFSISRSRLSESPEEDIRAEIRSHTGSDEEALGILRSVERMGSDPSILRYEIAPVRSGRLRPSATSPSWSVRAIRI